MLLVAPGFVLQILVFVGILQWVPLSGLILQYILIWRRGYPGEKSALDSSPTGGGSEPGGYKGNDLADKAGPCGRESNPLIEACRVDKGPSSQDLSPVCPELWKVAAGCPRGRDRAGQTLVSASCSKIQGFHKNSTIEDGL